MTTLALDFETAWSKDYSVAKMGPWAYCHDPRFDPYLVSVAASDGFEWVGHPAQAPWDRFARYPTWVSHNAGFDEQVFLAARDRGDFSSPDPAAWHCSADLCGFRQLPRALDKAVEQAFDVVLDKSVRERAGQQGDMFPPTEKELRDYALEDARWCLKLWDKYHRPWLETEIRLSDHTRMMGREGIGFDLDAARGARDSLAFRRAQIESEIPWADRGIAPTSRTELFAECHRAGILPPSSTAEKSPEYEAWLEQFGETLPWVRGLNQWRKINRTLSVVESMLLRADGTGRLHYGLKYYGAAITGRWSGSDGLNLQNLNRDDTAGGIDLRGLLIPKPGHVFIISDLAQIEPRCLAQVVKDETMLAFLRSGADLYEAHARATMGYADPRPLKEVDKGLRALAKARSLGLGYGCGPAKFVAVAKLMAGLDITQEDAEKTVADFRESNPLIVQAWARLEKLFRSEKNAAVVLTLPSGRKMRYFHPQGGQATATLGGPLKKFYGGLLAENYIQAMARDVLAEMVLAVEEAGLPVVLHVHDEIVVEVPEADAEGALATIEKIMTTPPEWADNLPLACEAAIAHRYQK